MDPVGDPTGLLGFVLVAVNDINRKCKDVAIHRRRCQQLAKRCGDLVNVLQDNQQSMDDSKLQEAVDELEEVLIKIRRQVNAWVLLGRIKSFMRQEEISGEIEEFNQTLDAHVTKFQIISSIELHRQQRRMEYYRQNDQEEVKDMFVAAGKYICKLSQPKTVRLRALVRNVEDLQAAVGMRDDVPALMQTIQEELAYQQPGTDDSRVLRGGLEALHTRTGILPPLTDLTGQVTKIGEHPAAEGGTADIYEGQWVGDEKVMLKAIRHVNSDSAVKRFRREVDIWRRLQNPHILRFYGICHIGPRLYAVAPWADNGNLLDYFKRNPYCDRMALLSSVAYGLIYLHTYKPAIVHGDLRAANVLVSKTGEALLADFGLSKLLAEEEGVNAASTSLRDAGAVRWMAPELFDMNTNSSLSTASDVWSFGMLCLEVLTGYHPYRQCKMEPQVIYQLMKRVLPERPEQTEDLSRRGLSSEMWALIQRCWKWNPSSRPDIHGLAQSMKRLQMEHMRAYGPAGESSDAGNPYRPYRTPSWLGSALATPPSTPSIDLPFIPGLFESPSPLIRNLPSDSSSPTNDETPRNNTIVIPRHRSGSAGQSPQAATSGTSSSLPRSETTRWLSQANHYRYASRDSSNSLTSEIARPHPEGEATINYDPDGKVLSGNLEGLVDRLLVSSPSTKMDDEFRRCFLTVYRGFAKAEDLLPLMIERYETRFEFAPAREQAKLRSNVMHILSDWLEIQEIEPKDRGFLRNIEIFVNTTPVGEQRDRLQIAIDRQFDKLDRPVLSRPLPSSQSTSLTELGPSKIAKQLMRLENELFQKILPSDCAAKVKNLADEHLQNLPRFNRNNSKIHDWCQSAILFVEPNTVERRVQMIVLFKQVAEECVKIRSFSTAYAILAGLSTEHVNKLSYTWSRVDKRTKDRLIQLGHLVMDTSNNEYKSALSSNPQAATVPILSVHMKELKASYEGMQTHVVENGKSVVNFQKFEEIWKLINDIMRYKTPPVNTQPDRIAAACIDYELSKIESGDALQDRFKVQSDRLRKEESKDYGPSAALTAAGFSVGKTRKK